MVEVRVAARLGGVEGGEEGGRGGMLQLRSYFLRNGAPSIISTRFGARLLLGRTRTEAPSHVIDLEFLRPLSLASSSER